MARMSRALVKAMGDSAIVWNCSPIIISKRFMMQPDCAVLKFREDGYASRLPTVEDVLLTVDNPAVEVPLLRLRKARFYAEAGVPECWMLDDVERRIEIHCLPEQKTYRLTREVRSSESVAPRLLADRPVRVAELLLPPEAYSQKSRA
jgi:Uma2 family endonuclease